MLSDLNDGHYEQSVMNTIPSISNFRPLCIRKPNGSKQSTDEDRTLPARSSRVGELDVNDGPSGSTDTRCGGNFLYRSSSPDFISASDICDFRKLGIKSIVDMRSVPEYNRPLFGRARERLLDQSYFDQFQMDLGTLSLLFPHKFKAGERVKTRKLNPVVDFKEPTKKDDKQQGKHFFINFFTLNFFLQVTKKASNTGMPMQLWLLFLIASHYVSNFLFGTWFFYWKFIQCYARNVINNHTLADSYIDIFEYSTGAISAALKLLTDEENLPALVVCAYGKDRTGLVSALVLSCLGETKENILKDYAQSEKDLQPIYKYMYDDIVETLHVKEEFATAKSETMLKALNYLEDNYGSVQDYLIHIGFGLEEQQKLKKNILGNDQ